MVDLFTTDFEKLKHCAIFQKYFFYFLLKMEQSLVTFPTWEKYIVISNTIENLRVKDKRFIFHTLRKHPEAKYRIMVFVNVFYGSNPSNFAFFNGHDVEETLFIAGTHVNPSKVLST